MNHKDIFEYANLLFDDEVMKNSYIKAETTKVKLVLNILVAIRENPRYSQYLSRGNFEGLVMVNDGLYKFDETLYTYHKHVAEMTGLSSQKVGSIVRKILKLPCKRLSKGFMIIFDEKRMEELKKEYGLTESR